AGCPVELALRGYTPRSRATFEVRVGRHRFAVKAYANDPGREAALYKALGAAGLAGVSGPPCAKVAGSKSQFARSGYQLARGPHGTAIGRARERRASGRVGRALAPPRGIAASDSRAIVWRRSHAPSRTQMGGRPGCG